MDENIKVDFRELLNNEGKFIRVYLRSSKTKGENFDPYRNVGYTIERRNPIFIKALIKVEQPEKLIIKEMGLQLSGAVSIIVKNSDVGAIKASERIKIDKQDYTPFHEAVGNKFLIFPRPQGLSRIILFVKG